MNELTVLIVVFGLVLAFITVVGHGIWVFLAALFGRRPTTNSVTPDSRVESRRCCPRCRAPLGDGAPFCGQCGWPHTNREKSGAALLLHTMRRQLDEFAARGAVDPEIRARLIAAINAEERNLALPEQPPTASPAAAAVSPVQPPSRVPVEADPPEPTTPLVAAATVPHSPAPVDVRAQNYAASRQVATVAGGRTASATPPKQREALSRLFAAFMEEKNIRWGELVGGLLIVGCSIALVISFWSQIADRPLLKFVLFNGVTAALFGIGLYTDRRWKIHTTSRGLLAIATLLVPLNFLAIAAFTKSSPPTDLLSLAGETTSLVFFVLLVYLAGRVLVPGNAALLTAGIILPCAMLLMVRRFASPSLPIIGLYALAAVPSASYVLNTLLAIKQNWSSDPGSPDSAHEISHEPQAHQLLVFLGLISVATAVPLALLVYLVPPARTALHWLAPLISVLGIPALLVGLHIWRRLTDRRHSGLQTAGVGAGVLGGMTMVAAIVFAWPEPATLMPTAIATACIMLVIAVGFGIPAAHVPAALSLAAAWLVGFYLIRGDLHWILSDRSPIMNSILSAMSGYALLPAVIVFAAIAIWLRSKQRTEPARMYALATVLIAAASLAFALWFGLARPEDPDGITWLLACYALAALAVGVWSNRADATHIGSVLLFAALGQGIVYRYADRWNLERPWVLALLAHATVIGIAAVVLRLPSLAQRPKAQQACAGGAQATSLIAAAWIAAVAHVSSLGPLTANLVWLAAIWMVLSILKNNQVLFMLSQAVIVLAIFCGVAAAVEYRDWYLESRHPWLDPWFIQAQGIALALYCMVVSAFREVVTQSAKWQSQFVIEPATPTWRSTSEQLLNPRWLAVDHMAQCAIVLALVILATYAVVPGAAQELAPTEVAGRRIAPPIERFEVAGIPHWRAASEGAWMLLAAVALTMASGLRQGEIRWRLAGLLMVVFASCLLIAARWEAQVAVASALRWFTAGAFAFVSIPICWPNKKRVSASASSDQHGRPLRRELRDWTLAILLLVYILIVAYVFLASLTVGGVAPVVREWWTWAVAWAILAVVGGAITLVANRNAIPNTDQPMCDRHDGAFHARSVLMLLAVAPLFILAAFSAASALDARPIVGPEPGTWFQRIGAGVSYGGPLVVIALGLVGYAIRDRSSGFAFAAGLLVNVVATIVVLIRAARGGGTLDPSAWITVAQTNALVAAAVALCWLAAIAWHRQRSGSDPLGSEEESSRPSLLFTQVALAAVLCGTFLAPAVLKLTLDPVFMPAWLAQAGSKIGWIGLGAATAALLWLNWKRIFHQPVVSYFVAAWIAAATLFSLRWDTGNWLAYHVLLAGCAAAAWFVPLLATSVNRWFGRTNNPARLVSWSSPDVRAFSVAAVALALRAWNSDPASPWWTVAPLIAISARNVWIAWYEGGRTWLWIAAALANLAASAWWVDSARQITGTQGRGQLVEFLWVNSVAWSVVAIISAWIERKSLPARSHHWQGVAFHRFAAWATLAILLLITASGLLNDLAGRVIEGNTILGWLAWLIGAAAVVASLWDPSIRWPIACLYLYGFVAVGMFLAGLDLQAPMFHWALANSLAAYSLATSALWSKRDRLRELASRLGMPVVELGNAQLAGARASWHEGNGHGWLVTVNFLLGIAVVLLVARVVQTTDSFAQRSVAAYAVGAQAFALGLLARGAVRTPLQYLALVWGVLFAVAFGWAWLPPSFPAPWLHRWVITLVAVTVMVMVYGFGFAKLFRRENEWTRAAARLVPVLAVLGATLILLILGIEVAAHARSGSIAMAGWARIAVGLALAGLAAGALAAALVPGRDPLGLSERGRTAYVYAAEVLVALLCLHIRVTMPWLFRGWFQQFWPLVVMAIAFLGVGFGELFQRRRQRVLSEPLRTTGALLPLLPAIGFWFASSRVDYSLLLLAIGGLYAALSALRRSAMYGALAVVAANGSLWYLLSQREGVSFAAHPQLWLIPPALCALAAGYINRERLSAKQSAALRYAAAIVIYVSSTADVFINGVADAPWLPAVLAGISILGVMAGILMRVRAFLYLGTAFLLVALMTIIWHAAIHQQRTWILWLAGIVTGMLIIAMFGLFEKRRDDVLRLVEELKHWHA